MAYGWSITQRVRASAKKKADGMVLRALEVARDTAQQAFDDLEYSEEYDGPINIEVTINETKSGYSLQAKGHGVKAIEYGADGSEGFQVLYKEDGTAFWFFQPADPDYERTPVASKKWRPSKWVMYGENGGLLSEEQITADWETYNKVSKGELGNDKISRSKYIHEFGEQGDFDDNWIYTEGNEAQGIMEDAIETTFKDALYL